MVKLTMSMKEWLWRYHREVIHQVLFGHVEVITDEMYQEYLAWCTTDEGRQYLKGGSKYAAVDGDAE